MRGRMHWLMALLAVTAMLGAACGNGDDAGGDGTTAPPAVETTTPAPDDTGGETVDTIEMMDFEFVPPDPAVGAGATVTLENTGAAPHTFTVTDTDIDVEVEPGQSGEATIDLDPGSYDFICEFHEGQGMVGTLTVA